MTKTAKTNKATFNRPPREGYEIRIGPQGEEQRLPTGALRLWTQRLLVAELPQ